MEIKLGDEQIARVAHEVNRAYCLAMGDASQVPWEDAPEWQRRSAVKGVQFVGAHWPYMPPAESVHQAWVDAKLAAGWVHGPVKDADRKQHPCMVPYADLPATQRVKDHLFRAVVSAMRAL